MVHDATLDQHAEHQAALGPIEGDYRTYYDILMVSPHASAEVIEVAFLIQADGLARRAGETASAELRTLEEAYACLRDANRRSQYDRRLKTRTVLGGSQTSGGVRRQRTCWSCQRVLDPFAAYCSGCHWMICGACSSCGCQHPTHRVSSRCAMIHPIWLRIALSRPDRLLAGVLLIDGLAVAALTLYSRALFG